ncbi:MAG: type II toxin-antitoxin system PemK/MazF family toxin [Chloroflexi bacterium]|nr:type II toxin-antitoxin system PemK/MazF family toxin [Chloroflexota bacterium]
MHRGELWWGSLPPPAGRRPVLLLSRESAYEIRASVTVAPATRTIRQIPTEVVVDESDGMPTRCVVNLDDIMTIPRDLLEVRITILNRRKMTQVARAIRFALAIDD